MNKMGFLSAMSADSIPSGHSGLWYIAKSNITESTPSIRDGKTALLAPGRYTFLYRLTDGSLHHDPPGVVVMEDTPFELMTHLGFVMQAFGNVLITGLGLGCVIRGLLVNPNVKHITCIENSKNVLRLVYPHMQYSRLEVVEADALEWSATNTEKFDCAWHDLWTDQDKGEPHLDMWHARLLMNLHKYIKRQGAWAFSKQAKDVLLRRGFDWIG